MRKTIKVLCAVMAFAIAFSSLSAFAAPNYGRGDYGYGYGNDKNYGNNSLTVLFYIQINGEQLDTNGNISGRDSKFFTDVIDTGKLKNRLAPNYSIAVGGSVTEADILANVTAVPKDKKVFEKVAAQYKEKDAYLKSSNGKVIPWSRLTDAYYKVSWYVLKNEDNGWHVDGVIIEKDTDKEISVVVPEEKAERASCVEYDVKKGTFTPGVMSVKGNRPHSVWEGDNDKLVMDGFHDVWYTVLDEDTFKENGLVIPQKLMDAATAVAKLAGARLSELDTQLQKQFGRIDSQAYKQEYISRNGRKTLYVTPYITERLASKYDVSNDDYIWLAEGDSQGNIVKVYVMDRNSANIDNIFDGE